jgi:hypothetical protein
MATTTRTNRTVLVAFRMTPEEQAMLQELARVDGLYQSDVLRMLVRRAHETRFGGRKPKPSKRAKQ